MKKNIKADQEYHLVELLKKNDSGAMRRVYDRYVEYLSAVCARYIVGEADRKDVLQDTFIKIFTTINRFEYRGEGSLKAWMKKITVNEALRFLQKNVAANRVEYEPQLHDCADEPEIDGLPDEVINYMILSLPTGYRMVFNLYVFEQKSHKEIGQLLGIAADSSASQFSRAKSLLAKKVEEYKLTHQIR